MARIILKFKELVLKDFSLQDGGKTIGRAPGNDVVLENLLVSGHHARIDQAGGDYILTDLQSKNGTYVNGARITTAKLKHGDQILVGKHTLVFELDAAQVSAADKDMVEATRFAIGWPLILSGAVSTLASAVPRVSWKCAMNWVAGNSARSSPIARRSSRSLSRRTL